ncbi:MAG: FimB/Mfa2 family fimbrial subunit, partial [Odoribacteraceae bacterium]|nr:FimB/Mfa2 family fimbrial subunit [Odoribacteraceae bacterium]
MKNLILILSVFLLLACDKEELLDGKETRIRFGAFELGSQEVALMTFSSFRVIVLQDNVVVRYFTFSSEKLLGNELAVNLPIGSYKLLFIANGPEEEAVSCEIGDPLEAVLLNLLKRGEAYDEAADFLTAVKQVNITTNSNNLLSIALRRKVGKIRVTLTGLSADIDSIKIELDNVPKSFSADGKVAGSTATILKRMAHVKGAGTATADIMTFPVAANKAEIGVLYSIGHVTYRGFMKLAPAVDSNRIVTVTGHYLPTLAQGFNFDAQAWDEVNLIDGGDMDLGTHNEVVVDNTPPAGVPVGGNLLQNGGFETWPDASSPPLAWSLSNEGADKIVHENTNPAHVFEGGSSCFMGSRTYLYQDIPVTERTCYQISLRVKSNTEAYKWRVYCSWRRTASAALPAAANVAIQTAQAGATDGWVEVFEEGNKFRAPVGAKILRVEIRTYSAGD